MNLDAAEGISARSTLQLSKRKLRSIERERIYGRLRDNKGWQPKMSGGVKVWQMIEGGRFAPAR